MSTLLKKMNLKQMGCEPKVARDSKYAPDKNVLLAVIYGRASGTKSGENRTGNSEIWTALTGAFEGENRQTGQEEFGKSFQSGMVFLPGGSQELVEGLLNNLDDKGSVEFAFEIYARHDEKSPVGYRYQIANLKPPVATDDLASLRQIAGVIVPAPAIEAPKETAPAIEAPKETAPTETKKKK